MPRYIVLYSKEGEELETEVMADGPDEAGDMVMADEQADDIIDIMPVDY